MMRSRAEETRGHLLSSYNREIAVQDEKEIIDHRKSDFWHTFFKFLGPGYLVAVGYLDPGNWATDIEGGSRFGYTLLFIILFSNISAILFQSLCIRLGVVSGNDLAAQCRKSFPRVLNVVLYILAEISIIATDLANLIGSAISLKLLFNIPLIWSVLITGLDVMIILKWWGDKYQRYYELFVFSLVLGILVCFSIQIGYTQPVFLDILKGYLPTLSIITDSEKLFQAVSIIGATVMPHNLYLHSSVCRNRRVFMKQEVTDIIVEDGTKGYTDQLPGEEDFDGEMGTLIPAENEIFIRDSVWMTIKFSVYDTLMALTFAFIINSIILIVGASAIHNGSQGLEEAYEILKKYSGGVAATCFAIALLFSAQSSSITGTLAGEIIMSGFLEIRVNPAVRRIITRLAAIVPAMIAIIVFDSNLEGLIMLSQVILSAQLPFAIFPLVYFTSRSSSLMKLSSRADFSNSLALTIVSYVCGGLIAGLNIYLAVVSFIE